MTMLVNARMRLIDAVTWCIGLLHVATPLIVAAGVPRGTAHVSTVAAM